MEMIYKESTAAFKIITTVLKYPAAEFACW